MFILLKDIVKDVEMRLRIRNRIGLEWAEGMNKTIGIGMRIKLLA
jgi:hypothetical protein